MSTLSCRFCTHRNPPGARFCNDCGSPLALRPCPKCEAITDAGAERCHQCGASFDANPIAEPLMAPASAGQRDADLADDFAAGGPAQENAHVPVSLAGRLDGSGMHHLNEQPAAAEVVAPITGHAAAAELDDALAAHRNRAAATRRRWFWPPALAASLIAIGIAGYFTYVDRTPELRRGGDVALVGEASTKSVPADSMREATAIDGSTKGTPAEPAAARPVLRSPAPAAPMETEPVKSQPEPLKPRASPATLQPEPAASQPEPVKSRAEPGARARKASDAAALATQRLIARDLGGFAEAPRSFSPPPDRDAIETQRLIERDLGPFLYRNTSGATGGAFRAIN